jgi:P27 family predicted phage terminase small subunit
MGSRGPVSELKLPPKLRLVTDKKPDDSSAQSKVNLTAPEMPADLPESLQPLWEKLVGELDDAGLISSVDGPTLELALRHYAAAVAASDELLRDGSTEYDNKNQRTMKNPASQVFRDHSTAFLEFAKQLGLSFAARARTTVAKEADDGSSNPFAVNS